ncbi:hypothetical protein ACMFMF_011896, partial [Clarireedia jacksonii]
SEGNTASDLMHFTDATTATLTDGGSTYDGIDTPSTTDDGINTSTINDLAKHWFSGTPASSVVLPEPAGTPSAPEPTVLLHQIQQAAEDVSQLVGRFGFKMARTVQRPEIKMALFADHKLLRLPCLKDADNFTCRVTCRVTKPTPRCRSTIRIRPRCYGGSGMRYSTTFNPQPLRGVASSSSRPPTRPTSPYPTPSASTSDTNMTMIASSLLRHMVGLPRAANLRRSYRQISPPRDEKVRQVDHSHPETSTDTRIKKKLPRSHVGLPRAPFGNLWRLAMEASLQTKRRL